MRADGSAEERQAILITGGGTQTSFAAGMILEELCHVENHALDDEVAALLCPAQTGGGCGGAQEHSHRPRAQEGERGRWRTVRSRISPPLAHPAARLSPDAGAVPVAPPVLRDLFRRHRGRLVLASLLCDRCQHIRGQAGRRGHSSALTARCPRSFGRARAQWGGTF
jgi:hypothetical protein